MRTESKAPLAPLTTLRLGGPATTLVEVSDQNETIAAIHSADEAGTPVLVLAGGSNVVVADAGFDGLVVLVRSTGFRVERRGEGVRLTAAAGEPWDQLVEACVADGLAGIECLSGIPGSAGATPIQNVGAYGQEVAETITAVTVFDRRAARTVTLGPRDCRFSYRHSAFKGNDRFVVLEVVLELRPSRDSGRLRYGELTRVLGVPAGGAAPLGDVRDAVLALRRSKGMVLDDDDPDTRSVGSFFTNPVLTGATWDAVRARCADHPPPRWEDGPDRVKTSAAWLIERAGFTRGYGRNGVAISSKHTLALTNRGGGSTTALLELAREVRDGVEAAFGVRLVNEPVLVGERL